MSDTTTSDTAKTDTATSDTAITDAAQRWRRIAGTFTERVDAVPSAAWLNPTACENWVARDIVQHLVDWVPPFLHVGAKLSLTTGPDVGIDPSGAWRHLNNQIISVLDAPDINMRTFDHPQAGQHPLGQAIERFILGDILIHTWDLARATRQNELLDPDMVAEMLVGLEPLADVLAQSGHYGPRIETTLSADNQTKLLALTGRNPA
jgi:uncharacterized protein (TIGR03086 family)